MRNYSPSSYAYLPLRILNPYTRELMASPANQEGNHPSMNQLDEIQTEGITISGLKDHYGTGEPVDIEIQIPENLRSGQYSLGVAKTKGLTSLDYLIERDKNIESESFKVEFFPEISGLTLYGEYHGY